MLKSARARELIFGLATAVAGLTIAGCAVINEVQNDIVESFDSVDSPNSQAEAASTHVAVVAVAPWDEYAKAIQPTFAITPADALAQAIPATASFQSRIVDAVRLGVQAGLPTSGTTETVTENTDATGAQTATSSRETRNTPGTLPTLPGFLGQVPGAGSLTFPSATLGEDPFLKYSIATDLYEEVQILNRVLEDAEISQQVEPYFLRIKVAVVPYRRDLDYDVYNDLNFFIRNEALTKAKVPIVVPLLVTDNLEAATDVASAQFIADFSAALSGSLQSAAIGGQLQSVGDRLSAALANERNSLRTVGRLGENAIRVRFGATLQAGRTGRKDYELLPRTHTLSLLLLMPRDAMQPSVPPRLGIVSQTILKKARTGEQLERFRGENFETDRLAIVEGLNLQKRYDEGAKNCIEYGQKTFREPADWVGWMRFTYAINGDYENYYDKAKCMFTSGDPARLLEPGVRTDIEDLWLELVKFAASYSAGGQTIELPAVRNPVPPAIEHAVILTDNGKDATMARLLGGSGLLPASLSAELRFPATPAAIQVHLPAETISVDERGVTAMFPSLAALQLAPGGKLMRTPTLVLEHARDSLRREGVPPTLYRSILYTAGENAKTSAPDLKPDIGASRIVASAGEGRLTIGIQLKPGVPPQPGYIRIDGAEIDAASGGEIQELGQVKVVSSGRYTLSLRNLAPAARVTATVFLVSKDKAGKETRVIKGLKELEVVEAPRLDQAARGN